MSSNYSIDSILLKSAQGQALLELTFCFPLILLLIAGLANLGTMLQSIELQSDAMRYGAFYAYQYANPENSCDDFKNSIEEVTGFYVEAVLTPAQRSAWNLPLAEVSNTTTWDGLSVPYLTISTTTNSNPNCTFCFENLLRNLNYTASYSSITYSSCS